MLVEWAVCVARINFLDFTLKVSGLEKFGARFLEVIYVGIHGDSLFVSQFVLSFLVIRIELTVKVLRLKVDKKRKI